MKLSEMTTNQAADALVRIAEPAAEMINDEKVFEAVKKGGKLYTKHAAMKDVAAYVMRDIVPLLLKDHRAALYTVLSIMTGKTVKQIGTQLVTETYADIKNSVDKDLLSFFSFSTEATSSGATE